MQVTTIEQEIQNTLNAFLVEAHKKGYTEKSQWTEGILGMLHDLGADEYDVSGGGAPAWLYDLVWWTEDKESKLTSVSLVVESEWDMNLGGIKHDFEKLLVANAEHRLMICQAKKEDLENRFAYFENAIQSYQLLKKGDRFLIAVYEETENKFLYKSFVK